MKNVLKMTTREIENVLRKVKRVKIKENLKQILTEKWPKEYTSEDDVFFNLYAGMTTHVYEWAGDWWICEDDNYPIDRDCFEEEQ